ncbi:unnamed protein product [Didymodactylos carnosus]|uniref:EamA domain-containing protein n=1 Tax=Didymodactylos carnosus TaxID=1234261 RepID=A0A815RD90_9BILA|nr:unnamed protein product [Didymodactylos carnosus]CAF1474351.1 unnamed protein product [Didymodactylos carnosus]CAF4216020.1 unnamed protein product [Didymodactylos carnosus]CAF4341075.1 unnamed protein product [Didymodactylos carnosus]
MINNHSQQQADEYRNDESEISTENDVLNEEANVAIAANGSIAQPSSRVTLFNRFSGIIYCLLSAFLFTVPMFIIKQLKVDLFDALLPRFILQVIIFPIYLKIKGQNILNGTKQMHFLVFMTCVFATLGYIAFFVGYNYLPLPDLTTIRYSQVIWTAIAGMILFRQKPTVPLVIGIILTVTGIILVAQPTFLFNTKQQHTQITYNTTTNITLIKPHISYHLVGFTLALLCSIFQSINVLINKKIYSTYKIQHVYILLMFSIQFLIVLIINLLYKYFVKHFLLSTFLTWQYLVSSVVCLLTGVSSILILMSIKREHPSVFTVVQTSDILFAMLLQNIFTKVKSNLFVLLGSSLVLISIFLVAGHKLYLDRKKAQPMTVENKHKT